MVAGVDERVSESSVVSLSVGTSKICFTPADADSVTISVRLVGEPPIMLPGFPVEVDCLPGEVAPEKTVASIDGTIHAIAGQLSQLRITTFDGSGHVTNPDISKSSIVFDGPGDVISTIALEGPIVPQTGVTLVNFTATAAGFYEFRFHIGSIVVGPFNVTVLPGDAAATKSVLVKNEIPATAGGENTFSISTYDELGNPVSSGGVSFKVEIVPVGHVADSPSFELTDSQDGSYTITWAAQVAGVYQVTVLQLVEVL